MSSNWLWKEGKGGEGRGEEDLILQSLPVPVIHTAAMAEHSWEKDIHTMREAPTT